MQRNFSSNSLFDFIHDWNANCKPEQKISIPKAGPEAKYKEIVDTIIQMGKTTTLSLENGDMRRDG